MLAPTPASVDASDTGDELPLLVQLPEHMFDYFEQSGYLNGVYGEQRGNARLRVRCVVERECVFVPAFVRHRSPKAKVLMKDLSRSGIGLLSHEQLWPGETLIVHLMERRLNIRVVRCRKLGEACFEVGGVLVD